MPSDLIREIQVGKSVRETLNQKTVEKVLGPQGSTTYSFCAYDLLCLLPSFVPGLDVYLPSNVLQLPWMAIHTPSSNLKG